MSTSARSATASLRVFLERIIDYAGLFPPASLDMMASVDRYARYLQDPQSWALGRFVLPVARLDEFLNAQENVATNPWLLSGIVSNKIEAELKAISEFNQKAPGAVIETVEVRVEARDQVELVRALKPAGVLVFFEIPVERSDELLPLIVGDCAKIRTGGTTVDAFPAITRLVEFIGKCAQIEVPFKATAGLHHPICGVHPLTYEPNATAGKMHGFLNLFTAAAMAWSAARAGYDVPHREMASCLADDDRTNWHFGQEALTWNGEQEPFEFDLQELRAVRAHFALSFGSCSFEEPLRDLHDLDLL